MNDHSYVFSNPTPLAHSRVEVLNAAGLPIVLIILPDGSQFAQWDRYRDSHDFGTSAQVSYSRSIGRFIDFLAARGKYYEDTDRRPFLFQDFVDALILGTIQGGTDATGLYWLPTTSRSSKRTLLEVLAFVDWLAENAGVPSVAPYRNATLAEEMVFWRAWRYQKESSLYKHLKTRASAQRSKNFGRTVGVGGRKRVSKVMEEVKTFPEHFLMALLKAFRRSRQHHWTTLRDQLVTILLHAGNRMSDVLHMWVCDVFADPHDKNRAEVRLYHPHDGAVPFSNNDEPQTRAAYLKFKYDLLPLTDQPGKRKVGWKDIALNDAEGMYARVVFLPDGSAEAFLRLFREYMKIRPRVTRHPYLFVTSALNPMTPEDFRRVHDAAVRRIGLIPAKELGTTPHGHRHAYGTWLDRNGVSEKIIQLAMHHKSVKSQTVYTAPTIAEIAAAIQAAAKQKANSHDVPSIATPLLTFGAE